MIFKKHQKMIGAFICAAVLSLSALTATAATYKDVPQSHAAYAAIDWISTPANGAVMVGDAANNFNPGRTLDKFEAVKIFASAAGFKYTSFSATPEELAYFERSYELYKPLLDSYSA
ncbi:MAG: hypothetical protein FWE82_04795, partial [Defluviitaleaceae bacterium]|nr:hypothetical protein [Defluviitaleaceae bacterium]